MLGKNVGLIDADIYGPSIHMFDVENEKPLITNIEGASLIEPVVAYGVN